MRCPPLTREERAILDSALVALTARFPAWSWRRPRREVVGVLVSKNANLPTLITHLYVGPPSRRIPHWSCGIESGVGRMEAPTLDALMAKMTVDLPVVFQRLADAVRGAV